MITGKSLPEIISAFRAKVTERREKIGAKIAALEQEAAEIRAKAERVSRQLVEAEFADDTKGQETARRLLRQLRQELDETQNLMDAYRGELNNCGRYEADIVRIRAAAAKERKLRLEGLEKLTTERSDVQRQIDALQEKLKQIDGDIERARVDAEARELARILGHIDPRLEKIPSYEHERVLGHWISGNDEAVEQILSRYLQHNEHSRGGNLLVTTTTTVP